MAEQNPWAGFEQGPATPQPQEQNPWAGFEQGSQPGIEPSPQPAPVPQSPSGLKRFARIIGESALNALSGAFDTIANGQIISHTPSTSDKPFEKSNISDMLQQGGLINSLDLAERSPAERLAGEAGSGLAMTLATGGTALPEVAAGVLGGMAGPELGPTVAAGLTAMGVPAKWADTLGSIGMGVVGGGIGAAGANGLRRAFPVAMSGEGPAATLGAIMPGARGQPNPAIIPQLGSNVADTVQHAANIGIDIPAGLWNGPGKTAAQNALDVPPSAIANAHSQVSQAWRQELGIPPSPEPSLTNNDIQTALKVNGQKIADIGAKLQIPQGPIGDKLFYDMANLQHQFASDLSVVPQGSNAVTNKTTEMGQLEALTDRIANQIATGPINGDQYLAMTQYGSPLYAAIKSPNSVLSSRAGQIRDALEDAVAKAVPPEDVTALGQARQQYRLAKTLEDPSLKTTAGALDPQQVFAKVNSEYSGKAPGNIDTIADAAQYLPALTKTGAVAQGQSPASLLGQLTGNNIAGTLAGVTVAAHEMGVPLLELMQNHLPTTAAIAGAGGIGLAAGKALSSAQRSYNATPQATQELIKLIRGEGPLSRGTLRGGIAGLPSALGGQTP